MMVEYLQGQQISMNREIRFERAWVEGELEQSAAVAQVEERMGALEVGLAAQVQHAEESMPQIEFQRLWVEGELKGLVSVTSCGQLWHVQMEGSIAKLNADAERLYQRGRTAGERLQQVAAGVDESTNTLLEKGNKLQRWLRNV